MSVDAYKEPLHDGSRDMPRGGGSGGLEPLRGQVSSSQSRVVCGSNRLKENAIRKCYVWGDGV